MSSNKNKTICYEDFLDPDHELLVWEKWINIRKEETEHLSRKTGRVPIDLVMNKLENVRQEKERKIVLSHAQVDKKETIRNTLWEQPARLKQKCYSEPVYEAQRTCAEIGRPKVIEHIGVPRRIQVTEKGIAGISKRKSCAKLDSSYKTYRDEREKELDKKIKKIDPFRPQIDDLIVVGKKSKPPKPKLPPPPTISITSYIESEISVNSIYALRINDTVFLKDKECQKVSHLLKMQFESWHEPYTSWSYYFNCPINRAGRSNIMLHNLGTVSLRYCWKKIKVPYEDTEDQVFFFNKNENVIYPGQEQNISITFISSSPGSYSERWEIMFLNVSFFETETEQLIINLHADSVENITKIKRKIRKIESVIYNKVLKNIASDLLEEILVKVTSIEPQIYPYKKMLLEAEMFVMKNPVCFYHQTEVIKLESMFSEMAPDEIWDLSITSWRRMLIEKEFEDRMKYYEFLRKSHRECLKPWNENTHLLTQKYNAVKQLLGQLADIFDKEFDNIFKIINNEKNKDEMGVKTAQVVSINVPSSMTERNIFYMKMYEHVSTTIEMCAGIISSLDLNRWIHFDFCHS